MILREIKNIYVPKIQSIEYLESTGTQYIDTEFKHNNNTRFVTLLSFQSVSAWDYPFGAFGDSNKRSIFALEIDNEERLYSYYGYINAKKSFNQKVKLNYLYNIDFNKNTHTINDTSVVHDTSNFSSIYNTFIFASSNYDGIPTPINKVRCYYFQIYDNGTLVRDFIPVRIGTKGYMLDKVSGELYGNSGTGDFILGQDVGSINYSKNLQQIYQNKLIEGVDYETYDWLKGDDTAYIEWSANLWNNQLHTIIGKDEKKFIMAKFVPNPTSSSLTLFYDSDPASHAVDYLMVIFRSESNPWHIADIVPFSSMPDVVDFKFYINNNVGYCKTNNTLYTGHSMATAWNDNVKFNVYGGKMKLLEEYDSTNDKLISSLVPCTLLRSIPRNLDAQCKERVAGECGMIDLISGKFYGNVASSGTFTVENDSRRITKHP